MALRRRWAAVCTGGLVFLVLSVALPVAVVGPGLTVQALGDWYAKIVEPTLDGSLQGSKIRDQSPAAGLRRLVVNEPAFDDVHVNFADLSRGRFHLLSRTLTALLAASLILAWYRSRPARPPITGHDAVVASVAMVLLVGYNLKAHFVGLYLPHLYVATRIAAGQWRPARATLAFGIATTILILAAPTFLGRGVSNLLYAWLAISVATILLVVALGALPREHSAPGKAPAPTPVD